MLYYVENCVFKWLSFNAVLRCEKLCQRSQGCNAQTRKDLIISSGFNVQNVSKQRIYDIYHLSRMNAVDANIFIYNCIKH